MDSPEVLFASERARLVGLAYRILGSRLDAEDVVQEAWFRLQRSDLESGLVVSFDRQPFLAASFTVVDGKVSRVHLMRNPSKLAALALEGELA